MYLMGVSKNTYFLVIKFLRLCRVFEENSECLLLRRNLISKSVQMFQRTLVWPCSIIYTDFSYHQTIRYLVK